MKERLTEDLMAMRTVRELRDGDYVNLGLGIPSLLSSYIPEGKAIYFHSESGVIGFGRLLTADEQDRWDYNLVNATGQYLTPLPGMSIVDIGLALSMVRGGRLDVSVLGGLQVSEEGDLANWIAGGREKLNDEGRIGGSMDIATGARRVIVMMTHNAKDGQPKVVKKCTYLVTRRRCVSLIVTDLAVIEVTGAGLVLKEVAPGWTPAEVQACTEAELTVVRDLKEIEP